MRAEHIEHLITVGRPTIARDGAFVVFASSRPSIEANRGVGRLWRIDFDTRVLRPLTRGVSDTAPRLSPDDTRLAFLRGDADGKPQVWVVESGGGEPVQVTDQPLGVSGFAWSPDGTQLAFTAAVPEQGRYGTVEGLDGAAEAPRRITGLRWHANGRGWTNDRPHQLFLVAAPDMHAEPLVAPAPAVLPAGDEGPKKRVVASEATVLTSGALSHSGVAFTRDGGAVLTLVEDPASNERDLSSTLVAVRADGSGEEVVVAPGAHLSIAGFAVADDGTVALLAADVGESGVDFVATASALWILDGGVPRRLTDPETCDLAEMGSHITPSGEDFLVQNRTRGRVELLRVSRVGEITTELSGDVCVGGHDAAATGRIVAAVSTPDSFGELVEVGVGPVTDFGAPLRASEIVSPQEYEFPGRDGYPVHGWVATPAGSGPFPVILQIHGGPYAQYSTTVFDETQVLVDAGYAVVYSNPRGSAGYGRAHGRSIRREMGTVDFHDVLDFLDAAIAADPRLDGARVGIMGGSYGGYLTAWTIAHDHRFAGAIVERGFLDPVSFQGTSDIGSFFGDEYVGTSAEDMARQSPMAVVSQVTTPTLVMHAELDYRCPLEQATRYYSALKRQGTDAEMLIFPGEDHELTRSGRPRHRVERFDAVLDWWRRWLPVEG